MKIGVVGCCGHGVSSLMASKGITELDFCGYCSAYDGEKYPLYPQIRKFDDYKELIVNQKPDILVVDNIFSDHFQVIDYALQHNIHVFAEKPLAFTKQECERLRQLTGQSNGKLVAMQTMRYDPWIYTAKLAIVSNSIGMVRMINAQKSYKMGSRPFYYHNSQLYGGTILWVAIHMIDCIVYTTGLKYQSVYAKQSQLLNDGNGDMESAAICLFEMQNGALAHINVDFYRPESAQTHGDDRLRIVGTNGIIEVKNERVFLINDKTECELPLKFPPNIFDDFLSYINNGSAINCTQDSLYSTEIAIETKDSATKSCVTIIN